MGLRQSEAGAVGSIAFAAAEVRELNRVADQNMLYYWNSIFISD